jgi:hypothetical protein
MNAKMSPSEKIVVGLTIAVLIVGLASGVFAKPPGMSPRGSLPVSDVSASHAQLTATRLPRPAC